MEETKRKSFIFYTTYNKVMRKLAPEDQLLYIHTICDYYFDGVPIPETTGSIQVDIALASIEEVMAANDKRYRNAIKGGAPKGNSNATKTTKNNLNQPKTTENNQKQPNENMVDLENNQNQTRLNCKTTENESGCIAKQPNEKEKEKDNVKEKEKEKDSKISLSEVSIVLEPFFDEKKQRSYSGRIDRPDVFKITLEEWYEMDRDVLIDGMYSVNEYVESYQKYKGYPFEYNLPGTWDRKMVQLFREAMHEEYGDDISVSFR